ncbi:hypothetical protein BDN70DRAFT_900914 [Pholiota conissans]|uniref:Uncharacterized protein n=1 Tax=Pholiota conissans TaxID=109636 RepID=A0A9P5YME2_9AGAR|nr:hypothetical protein BDN70DRAFT_900914 [Pholiota conissans]
MSLVYARKPYENFGGLPYIIIAIAFWILLSGAAEAWFFARSGVKLYVSVNGVQVPQSEINNILNAAGIPVKYRSSVMWRVTIAFLWISWAFALAAAAVLFASDIESDRHARPTRFSGKAATSTAAVIDVNNLDLEKQPTGQRVFTDPFPLDHAGIGGDARMNAGTPSGDSIQEVPVLKAEKSIQAPVVAGEESAATAIADERMSPSPLDLGKN